MAIQKQPPLPSLVPSQSLIVWARGWLDAHYPDQTRFDRETLRTEMLADLPFRFFPSDPVRAWWRGRFRDVMRALEIAFLDGREGGEVVVQTEMPFDEFQAHCIDLLVHARVDIEAVGRLLENYVTNHQLVMDVPATLQAWKKAAGL